mgnify:CR=1 FL=1
MKKNRNTKQKELIYKEAERFQKFFNAEELHKEIIKKDKNLGVATVYRILKDMKNNNKLHSYICDRKIIYSKENKTHCHFICEKCHSINHILLDKIDFLKKNIDGDICHIQIDVSGICDKCRKI